VRSLHENYPPQMFYALMNLVGSHDRARVLNVLAGLSVKMRRRRPGAHCGWIRRTTIWLSAA